MCGIAGILVKKDSKKVSEEILNELINPIQHRGPDDSGIWIHPDQCLGFGHRRLSIIDLSEKGKQPFHREDFNLSITYNGEIYNYLETKLTLEKKGYRFFTSTDTEVILVAYREYGVKCLEHFDGMFAFALWDENKKELFCARDRFGEKPFHYYIDKDRFVFASEIKQFWSMGIPKKWNDDRIATFLRFSQIIDENDKQGTFFSNILSLNPATFLIINAQLEIKHSSYWELKTKVNENITFGEASYIFVKLLNQSLERRLRSDVSVGSSLSGGLDSSAIVYSINNGFLKEGQEQYTFSARFMNYEKDEGMFIDALTSKISSIKRHDVFLEEDEFNSEINKIIHHQDEPFQSASIFAQYKVMQLARKNKVTVLLDGQGADELLGGYETLYVDYLKQLYFNDTKLYANEVKSYNEMHGHKYGAVDINRKATTVLKVKRKVKSLLGKEQAVPADHFSQTLKQYICGSQLQQLLRYADRNSMAHSVETRLPFLSHELVEFVFTLPDSFKLREGWTKYILRKSFDRKLPDIITWRKDKVGFETPEENFLNGDAAKRTIVKARQWINDKKISGVTDHTNKWLLYMTGSFVAN